mmetsp:Transcript_23542/g.70442  ORF Transcript_23542/g.70442 Transcript_23542/m.70442 type:complete len:230 (+) Transcript_23542:1163-1852(+)
MLEGSIEVVTVSFHAEAWTGSVTVCCNRSRAASSHVTVTARTYRSVVAVRNDAAAGGSDNVYVPAPDASEVTPCPENDLAAGLSLDTVTVHPISRVALRTSSPRYDDVVSSSGRELVLGRKTVFGDVTLRMPDGRRGSAIVIVADVAHGPAPEDMMLTLTKKSPDCAVAGIDKLATNVPSEGSAVSAATGSPCHDGATSTAVSGGIEVGTPSAVWAWTKTTAWMVSPAR